MNNFIWFIIIVVVVLAFVYEQYVKREIGLWLGREIKSKGGILLALRKTKGPSRYNYDRTFEVVLASHTGEEYRTTCKVDWLNSEIYWSVSPTELLNRQEGPLPELYEATQMLSELNSPFRFARLAAVRALAHSKTLNDELLARLVQIAAEDEDPQVREEAKAIVRDL